MRTPAPRPPPTTPRAVVTRTQALDAALAILQGNGATAVAHAAAGEATGIARSTLHRCWPDAKALRNDAFERAARAPKSAPQTDVPLRADPKRMPTFLVMALAETRLGRHRSRGVVSAATNAEARTVIDRFMTDPIAGVDQVFAAVQARGEPPANAPVRHLAEASIAAPRFRKLIAGLPLDEARLDAQAGLIANLAERPSSD
ncbi:MAG: hypothetical protein AAF763_11870 [Pseudomonadota bacterium]